MKEERPEETTLLRAHKSSRRPHLSSLREVTSAHCRAGRGRASEVRALGLDAQTSRWGPGGRSRTGVVWTGPAATPGSAGGAVPTQERATHSKRLRWSANRHRHAPQRAGVPTVFGSPLDVRVAQGSGARTLRGERNPEPKRRASSTAGVSRGRIRVQPSPFEPPEKTWQGSPPSLDPFSAGRGPTPGTAQTGRLLTRLSSGTGRNAPRSGSTSSPSPMPRFAPRSQRHRSLLGDRVSSSHKYPHALVSKNR